MIDLMENTEKEFKRFRESLRRECNILFDRFSLSKRIRDALTDKNYRPVLEMSPAFWKHVRSALYQSSILSVTKLLSKKEGSLQRFLDFINRNLSMFEEENFRKRTSVNDEFIPIDQETIEDDLENIRSLADILENWVRRRNKEVAHSDEEYFFEPERINEDAPIEWDELDKIQEVAREIFNRYSLAFDGESYRLGAKEINDINVVFSILREHRERCWPTSEAGQS